MAGTWFPRSLRRQFIAALSALALLILAGSLVGIHALRVSADAIRQLADERLVRLQDTQDIVRGALLVERETQRMLVAASDTEMRERYAGLLTEMDGLDRRVERLGAASDDVSVLALHQSAQLLRNTVHVVASLLEMAGARSDGGGQSPGRFRETLHTQASALVDAAHELSGRVTDDYQHAVRQLAEASRRMQQWVLALLAGSLIIAFLVSHYFLGRHVLDRLRQVSRYLRRGGEAGGEPTRIPVRGDDEIGEMARAVEQFLEDRRQLALANVALEEERARQAELIRKLAEAHSQLLHAEKMASIGQLAAGVAHEINNPVGFVNSNLGTLREYADQLLRLLSVYEAKEAELSEEARTQLQEARREADLDFLRDDLPVLLAESADGLQRVKRIVEDLKDFSRVDAAEKQFASLEQGLDSTLNVVWNELKYKAEVVKEYGGIPEIECLPAQLNQVFMNLLVNAAQAIPERGRIVLRTGRQGDEVWVEVEDNGAGIEPAHLRRLFDPFFTTKPVGQGTGLGLSLSYGIVQRHGGRIEVRSEPGAGAVFRVVLPMRMPEPG
ncbi:ATP-binding protein [Azospira restricta]|uniref:histidine kinase n=2 Tax=Azospira restricta TaxID=404405 RepID=A0A974SP08_9RHOO|nr:ATP-binding protein [Azospira restricta]QRJ63789.1 HAMP domain-containing protein [Azospira restricta]